jgi:hypothetical protein
MIKDIEKVGNELTDEELSLAAGGGSLTGYITYFNNACYNDVDDDGDVVVIVA